VSARLRGALPSAAVAARLTAAVLALIVPATLAAGTALGAGSVVIPSQNPINDQGSNYHYSSVVRGVSPNVAGLSVQVLEFADRLLLENHTGRTVTIYGYQGEPYARVLANGTAEVNERSPATYLNASFYGNITVPASASATAAPSWSVIDRTGQFEWHDHRIHWASPLLPPEVKDKSRRTLIFDWSVPIAVGSQTGAITGQLFWLPQSSSAPVAVIVVGALIVALGLAFVVLVRRRRRGAPTAAAGGAGKGGSEAW
jgi:hypothetical protein